MEKPIMQRWSPLIFTLSVVFFFWYFLSSSLHGMYLNPDGVLYFSYLRSLIFDHDLLFVNEFDRLQLLEGTRYITKTGLEGNHVAVGTSLLMAPFYCLLVVISKIMSAFSLGPPSAGYNGLPLFAFPLGSLVYGIVTIIMMLRLIQQIVQNRCAFMTIFQIVFGTSFCFYLLIHNGLSHLCSAFTVTLFFYYFEKLRRTPALEKLNNPFFFLGLLSGLSIMVRTQNGLFWIVPFFYFLERFKTRYSINELVFRCFLFVAGVLVGVFPQLVTWKILNGGFFAAVESSNLDVFAPHVVETLFSSYHGLLFWTPVTIFSISGLCMITAKRFWTGAPYLAAFLLQLWINSSIYAWWEAASFSMRLFTNCSCVFALGLAYLYYVIPSIWLRVTGWIFVCWTLILQLLTRFGHIDLNIYYSPELITERQLNFVIRIFSDISLQSQIFTVKYQLRAFIIMSSATVIATIVYFLIRHVSNGKSSPDIVRICSQCLVVLIAVVSLLLCFAGAKSQSNAAIYRHRIEKIRKISEGYGHYMAWSYHVDNGKYYQAIRENKKAIQEYTRALALKADLIEVYIRLSNLLFLEHRYDEAIKIIDMGLNTEPDNVYLLKEKQRLRELGHDFYYHLN